MYQQNHSPKWIQSTLGEERSLAGLVLGDLVDDVLLAALAEGATGLGNVHLEGKRRISIGLIRSA